jgi:hypothetical protein
MVRQLSIRAVCGALPLLILASPDIARADDPIACTGAFARDADEAAIRLAYGDAATSDGEIYIGEGYSEMGTVVFPDDPSRRIEILWHHPEARMRPSAIILRETSTRRVAFSTSSTLTIGVGASLAEVELANGRPFEILGFDWDNGGTAGNWRGGALSGKDDDCFISLRFDPDSDAPGHAQAEVSGDRVFLSSDAAMRAVNPTVNSIIIGWPQ